MDNNVYEPPTFDSEGYEVEEWIPVFRPFDNHSEFMVMGNTDTYQSQLLNNPFPCGEEVVYQVDGGPGFLWLEYSPERRTENQEMLWGTIEFSGSFDNQYVGSKYEEILAKHGTAYTKSPGNGADDLGAISVPEDFSEEELVATTQAVVDMIYDARRLESDLKQLTEEFDPS